MRTTYFLVTVFGHCLSVGLMKSKIVKVKSFYNYLTNHLPAITEFSFFLGHPNVHPNEQMTTSLFIQNIYVKKNTPYRTPFNIIPIYQVSQNPQKSIVKFCKSLEQTL